MVIMQARSLRKASGASVQAYSKKKKQDMGRSPTHTKVGKDKVKELGTLGATIKRRLLTVEKANVFLPKEKKYAQLAIKSIAENPANRHFVRRSIITKGTVIETEKGQARVTSRPGQDGCCNAVLL